MGRTISIVAKMLPYAKLARIIAGQSKYDTLSDHESKELFTYCNANEPWPNKFPTVVKSKAEAMECCLPKEKVALACTDCKTVTEKPGEDKKGVAAWFAPDSMHDCSGCKGKITVKQLGKGPATGSYTHTCSKCGENSAYTCATHKKN